MSVLAVPAYRAMWKIPQAALLLPFVASVGKIDRELSAPGFGADLPAQYRAALAEKAAEMPRV